jgi:2-polyprenyl-6-methoxyphenol hydroxylase-like FAD-dependent oxidoreductase
MTSLKIAIVGGSIAGCCAGVELSRAGHRVEVFERSASALVGRGVAIGLMPDTLNALLRRDLVDQTLPRISIREHVLSSKSVSHEPLGRISLRVAMPSWSVNWADLHAQLRKRVPEGAYRAGVHVRGVAAASHDFAELAFEADSPRRFDLVVFADGHASLGRRYVCDVEPTYRGYVLWRGVLDVGALADASPLTASIYRIGYRGEPGQAIAYRMPGGAAGLVNFGCYRALSAEALPSLLVDRHGQQHAASLPAGALRTEEEANFRAFAQAQLPRYFAEIMAEGRATFVQPIFGARVTRQHIGRVCVLGDAAALVPPLTGSGVLRATLHAIGLARRLRDANGVDDALAAWDSDQTALGRTLSDLGDQMENAFIWNPPDYDTLDESSALRWWQAGTRPPPHR